VDDSSQLGSLIAIGGLRSALGVSVVPGILIEPEKLFRQTEPALLPSLLNCQKPTRRHIIPELHRLHCPQIMAKRKRPSVSQKIPADFQNSAPNDVIATWYVHDRESDITYFPQARSRSGTVTIMHTYMRCVCVFFAAARRYEKRRLMFFTNLTSIDSLYSDLLKDLGVEIVNLENVTRGGSLNDKVTWANQFYIFDIIRYVISSTNIERLLVADSDCVFRNDQTFLFRDIDRYGAVPFSINYSPSHVANGLSRLDLEAIYAEIYGELPHPIYYAGGEFFAANRKTLRAISAQFNEIRERLFSTFGNYRGGEEAHALSLIYARLGIPVGVGNVHVKRCWTNFFYSNISAEDMENSVNLLHLPAEKVTGFKTLFGVRRELLSMPEAEYLMILNSSLGLPKRNVRKWLTDLWTMGIKAIRNRMNRHSPDDQGWM
jgi:hypothetical protein